MRKRATARAPRPAGHTEGEEGRRRAHYDLRAQSSQTPEVGAGHAAVSDIADDDDSLAAQVAQVRAHRVQIKQPLSGMGVPAVAAVDHVHLYVAGHQVGRAGGAVTNHQDLSAHRLKRAHRIVQRLAFLDAGGGGGDVDDVGAQRLGRQLEGGAGAGARLVEQGDDSLATEGRHARHLAAEHLLHRVGRLHDDLDLGAREVVQIKDVTPLPGRLHLQGGDGAPGYGRFLAHRSPSTCRSASLRAGMTTTSSRPSVSSSRT